MLLRRGTSQGVHIVRRALSRKAGSGTPKKTRLAFAEHDMGKDANPTPFTSQEEALRKAVKREGGNQKASGPHSKVADPRALFDSDYIASATDDKTSDKIVRDVKADTPDATRVAFSGHTYGKDDSSPSFAESAEALKGSMQKPTKGHKESKIVGHRALYDSDYIASASDEKTSDKIMREVKAGTPDATRVAFAGHTYGKDHSEPDFAEGAEALKATMQKPAKGHRAAKVADKRAMFDSDYIASASDDKTSDKIMREVKAGTPDATRVAFAGHTYGKDHSEPDFAEGAEAMIATMQKPAKGHRAAKVADKRAMFDSDYTASASDDKTSDKITRDVKADTPDATRVAFAVHAYGKDHSAPEFSARAELMAKSVKKAAKEHKASKIVDGRRAMFDSDYMPSSASSRRSHEITREVKSDTPDETRVAFAVHTYGKDHSAPEFSGTAEVMATTMRRVASGGPAAKVVDNRALFDSDYTASASDNKTSDTIVREVKSDTPDATRIAFAVHTYGKDHSEPEFSGSAEVLAKAIKREVNVQRSHSHDHRALFDSVYSSTSCEKTSDTIRRKVRTATPARTRLSFFDSDHHEPPETPVAAIEEEDMELAAAEAAAIKVAKVAKHHDHRSLYDSDYGHVPPCDKLARRKSGQASP